MAGDESPRTKARWAASLDNLLSSPSARRKFRHFLETDYPRGTDPTHLDTLDFWEKCNTVRYSRMSEEAQINVMRCLAEQVESGKLKVNVDQAVLTALYNKGPASSALRDTLEVALNTIASDDIHLKDAFSDFTKGLS